MIRYCTRCLMPSTKPHITFSDDGVCNACLAHDQKNQAEKGIDWERREREFLDLIAWVKAQNAPYFDAMVPVSGGKDSITQVHKLLGHGLRILAVNIDYGIKTDIGRRNLARVPEMGATLFTVTPELDLHKKLIRIGFEDHGDPDLLSHCMLHAFPIRTALQFQVPLCWLGENSAFEYGGDDSIAQNNRMSRDWFEKFAANKGMDAKFIAREYDIAYERLINYDYPAELDTSATRALFSSYFFHWDSEVNLRIATEYGFEALPEASEGTYRNYVGIDERINRIHQYFKVLKFGYGRATDHACEDIRNGRLSRDDAKNLVRRHDLEDLSDDVVESFTTFIGMTRDEFDAVIETYRNRDIWQLNNDGEWIIPGHLVD